MSVVVMDDGCIEFPSLVALQEEIEINQVVCS